MRKINVKATQGRSRSFSIDGIEKHTIIFDLVTENKVSLTVRSTPKTIELSLKETKEVDITDNGENDISLTLNSINNGIVDLTLKKLTPTPEPTIELISEPSTTPEVIETGPSAFSKITGAVTGTLTSKPAKYAYGIIALVIVILVAIIQLGGIRGIGRKSREYYPRADYY